MISLFRSNAVLGAQLLALEELHEDEHRTSNATRYVQGAIANFVAAQHKKIKDKQKGKWEDYLQREILAAGAYVVGLSRSSLHKLSQLFESMNKVTEGAS